MRGVVFVCRKLKSRRYDEIEMFAVIYRIPRFIGRDPHIKAGQCFGVLCSGSSLIDCQLLLGDESTIFGWRKAKNRG